MQSFHVLGAISGENSIIIVGGANQAEWALSDAAKAEISRAGKSYFAACLPTCQCPVPVLPDS